MVDIFIMFLEVVGLELVWDIRGGESYLTKQGKSHRAKKDKCEQNSLKVYLTSPYGTNNLCIGQS
jgi:hypothetical protein